MRRFGGGRGPYENGRAGGAKGLFNEMFVFF